MPDKYLLLVRILDLLVSIDAIPAVCQGDNTPVSNPPFVRGIALEIVDVRSETAKHKIKFKYFM